MIEPEFCAASQTAAEWLLSRINYEKTGGVPYRERQLKLDRMRQFVTALGSPDAALPIIHIAGTKGKGSTAAMVAAVLTAAGYRTGVYSSPHLHRIEERFAIDGKPIDEAQLEMLVQQIRPVVDEFDRRSREAGEQELTFFDITTALALVYFAQQQCGAVVLEVGLGGRLDSTNVCLPLVSVITSISFDHTKQLGSTLTSIAREKAGIVKPGVPVVSGVADAEPRRVIATIAREHGCRLMEVGEQFSFDYHAGTFDYRPTDGTPLSNVSLGLAGRHQAANAAVALAVLDELASQGWNIPLQARRDGLSCVRLPGRFECLPTRPKVVIDTAHNAASAAALVATLDELAPQPRTLIVACSRDKDVPAIARELWSAFTTILLTSFQENPRSTSVDELQTIFSDVLAAFPSAPAPEMQRFATPAEAWRGALDGTPEQGTICVSGSFFLAAEMRDELLAWAAERKVSAD